MIEVSAYAIISANFRRI